MAVSLSYLDDLGRVRVSITGAPAAADYALVERSTDGVTWSTVRGAAQVTLSGGAGSVDDYEFAPGVVNQYRASYVDTGPMSIISHGAVTQVTGSGSVNLATAIPAGLQEGDMLVLFVASNTTSASVQTPSGWSLGAVSGNVAVFYRSWTSGTSNPNVVISGATAANDHAARITALRNVKYDAGFVATGTAQNITPSSNIALTDSNMAVSTFAWKASGVTSASSSNMTLGYTVSTSAGGAAESLVFVQGSVLGPGVFTPGVITMTGGASAAFKAMTVRWKQADYLYRETQTTTPNMRNVWIKNPARPYLNRKITVIDWSDITTRARSSTLDVIGRTYPVVINDVRSGKAYTITATTLSIALADELVAAQGSGDPVLLHVPTGCPFPGGYYTIGDISVSRPAARRGVRRFITLPLVECAAPSATIYPATITWQGVINQFTAWSALIAAEPTWSDVTSQIGTPTDVVVP